MGAVPSTPRRSERPWDEAEHVIGAFIGEKSYPISSEFWQKLLELPLTHQWPQHRVAQACQIFGLLIVTEAWTACSSISHYKEYKMEGGNQTKDMEKAIHEEGSSSSILTTENDDVRKPTSLFIPIAELIGKLSYFLPREKTYSIKKIDKKLKERKISRRQMAAAPVAWGHAMEVPEMMLYDTGGDDIGDQAAKMSTPGAVKSGLRMFLVMGFGPRDEKETTYGAAGSSST